MLFETNFIFMLFETNFVFMLFAFMLFGIHHFYGRLKKLIIFGHYFHNELFLRYP